MAKIPAWVFIAIGLFVAISSLFRYDKLKVFFYAGLAFIAYGLIKVFSKWASGKTELPNVGTKHSAHNPHLQIKYCSRCGSSMRMHDRFCIRCGARV